MNLLSRRIAPRLRWVAVALAGLLLFGSGCAPRAQVYQREHLVDRIMSFDSDARLTTRKMKTFEAREGSTGGAGGAGGGCACK